MRHTTITMLTLALLAGLGGATLTGCEKQEAGQTGEKLSSAGDAARTPDMPEPPKAASPSDSQAQPGAPGSQQPPERDLQSKPSPGEPMK